VKVSVIVPAYNAQHTIGHTLKALIEQDFAEQFEIITVDDGSTDQTANVIRSFASVRYVHQSNAGPASARNQGARLAQGEFLAFTDSDCIPQKDWLTCLVQGFIQPEVGVVMGSYGIANPHNLLAWCVHKEILFRHQHLLSDFPKVFGSYNFCVKKSVFEKAGGFNVSYRNASGEDNDLSYKIIALGARIYFKRNALVNHYHPTKVKKYLKEQYRHGLWRVQMYAAHPTMTQGDGYTFWKDIVEVPLSGLCLAGIVLSAFNFLTYELLFFGLLLPFLLFEIVFACFMINNVFKILFWGFIMFLRSFSRTLGFSTGILLFLGKKILNKP
jgi:glycosyltransferase involved in cell wall biosynthesis